MRSSLGDAYVERLFAAYRRPRAGGSRSRRLLVREGWEHDARRDGKRAGLVATNSMRGGANRRVLDRIAQTG